MDWDFSENIQRLSIQFVPFVMAVVFHEFAHGLVASKWGDNTAKDAGRLTLNPIPHMDPIGTLAFPIINMLTGIPILFGWARPVPIEPRNFRKFRAGLFWVSFAGPGMNFFMAFVSAALFCSLRLWVNPEFFLYEPFVTMAYVSISLNFALGIFNLIPLPPLDGSKMVESFLPFKTARKYEELAKYSFFILLALLWSGAFKVIAYPIAFCADATLNIMAYIFRLPEVL
jgi:Zn-dependent protease